MRLGFLLTFGPDRPEVDTCVRLARAALDQGLDVDVFLLGDGLLNAVRHERTAPFLALADMGAEIVLCAQAAARRGLAAAQVDEAVSVGGLFDLALMVRSADRFVSLS